MADNPAETAAAELQKWLAKLEELFKFMEAEKEKKAANLAQTAKEQLETKRFEDLLKELKEINKGINGLPDDTPGLDAAKQKVEEAVQEVEGQEAPAIEQEAPAQELEAPAVDIAPGMEASVNGPANALTGAGGGDPGGVALTAMSGATGGNPAQALSQLGNVAVEATKGLAENLQKPGGDDFKPGSVGAFLKGEKSDFERPQNRIATGVKNTLKAS